MSRGPAGGYGGARAGVSGRKVVLIGLVFVLLISAYVMVRIVQVSGPRPDPSTIPPRPGAPGPSSTSPPPP